MSHAVTTPRGTTGSDTAVPELTLTETLRVLEVARGMQRERSVAEQALARHELREVLKQRLLQAAVVTGDQVTEADVDAAIAQYFARLYMYEDPPMSFAVFLAHVYVRRLYLAVIAAVVAAGYALWLFVF
jgi:hypothetical protein